MIYLRKDKLRFCFYFYVQLFIVYLFIWTENKYIEYYGGYKNFNFASHFENSLRLKEYRILVEYVRSYYYEEPKVRITNYDAYKSEEYPSRYDNKNLEESFEDYVDNYEYTMRDNIPETISLMEVDSLMDRISIIDYDEKNNVEVTFPKENINNKNIKNINVDEIKSYIDTNVDESETKLWNEYINNIDYIKSKGIEYKYKYHTSTNRSLRSFVKYAKRILNLLYKIIRLILITLYRLIKYIIDSIFNVPEIIV
ncbi:Plasmodium exported protein, unknown function [Plasmodium sp. gorilla clade G3]|nr:Plasmodium exported protein, unknown function [Plasmodium sp. gorilla clade G3]